MRGGFRGGRGRGRGGMERGGRGGMMRGGRNVGAALLRNQLLSTQQTNASRRLQRDFKELRESKIPLVGVAAAPLEDDLFTWRANIRGPEQSAFYGGVFHMEIKFPSDYPCSAPTVTLMTRIPHPNVFGTKVCLDMLEKMGPKDSWYQGWNSAYTVESILIQLQSFLLEVPREARDTKIVQNVHNNITDMISVSDSVGGGPLDEHRNKYKIAVDEANAFRCDKVKHRGPMEPYPPFAENEKNLEAFTILRSPKELLGEEFLCYHSRSKLPEVSLGVGVSLSRLPRTGEIRSVLPTMDLLCLRAFTKQKIRKSIENQRFTHWLPLYFGEREPYQTTEQFFDDEKKEYQTKTHTIDPRERLVHLLKHSLCFMAKGSTTKDFTPEVILEILPKLIITHTVELANENKHISILALRRLVNFMRLFRLCIELKPEVSDIVNERIAMFKDSPEKRVKDHTSSLGDLLAMVSISDRFSIRDILDAYLEEQLDRQAFWIIKQVPELDHTDEKYKNKRVVVEGARAVVCFKTGLTGFQLTLLFYSLNEMLERQFGRDWARFEASVDGNFGCLDLEVENELQARFKKIQKIENFQDYYNWMGVACPDDDALATRLYTAVANSKAKKYHGSSEHMNELPELDDQTKEFLYAEPSPFSKYSEDTKKFTAGPQDDFWLQAVRQKFNWVRRILDYGERKETPSSLALYSDEREINNKQRPSLLNTLVEYQQPGYVLSEINEDRVYTDYSDSFSWRDLFHKLCFEQMLETFTNVCDFSVFYEYVNKLGNSIEVLRIPCLRKTKLKSNHYWVMVLMTKLTKLRAIKLHNDASTNSMSHDFFKFLIKGMNYMAKDGRSLEKIQMNKILSAYATKDALYQCLKPHQGLICLNFSHQGISSDDSKAIGKVLTDFKTIRELHLRDSNLQQATCKEIADGLMRAKQLEVLDISNNTGISSSVQTIIYNLAFSPRIRHINLSEMVNGGTTENAEAIYKLVKISGAIEILNLRNSGIPKKLTTDFYKALGENKTLRYLNLDSTQALDNSGAGNLGKAVAMNAYKNGSLEGLSCVGCFKASTFQLYLTNLSISDKDHEDWYGDAAIANKMEKEQLEKHLYCKLRFFNPRQSPMGMYFAQTNYKHQAKQLKPNYNPILTLVTKTALTLNFRKCGLRPKDMETFSYMLADSPAGCGDSKLESLSLSMNDSIGKEGAKLLRAGLEGTKTLKYLNLSSCSLGVSGMVQICQALKVNTSLETLSVYRNRFDVDGARALGSALKVNKTLKMLDIGHNRIRLTGMKSIVEGMLSNPESKVTEMCLKWNFINDEGITYLFEKLILPANGRDSPVLSKVWIKNNFLSEYHKIGLHQRLVDSGAVGKVFVDDFEGVTLLSKEYVDRSIWIAPMPSACIGQQKQVIQLLSERNECGLVVDVRFGKGRKVPGRTRDNLYCVVEYAHENSVPRSLKLASKKLAKFQGMPVRIYKAGTKTAINMPRQRRAGM